MKLLIGYAIAGVVAITLQCVTGCSAEPDVAGAYAAAKARRAAPVEAPKPERIIPVPDPAFVAPVIVEPIEPVVELYVFTAEWCTNCKPVHDAAGGLTGITFIDIDELPDEVLRINGEIPPSLPCFVRMVDGVRVDRWLGATDRAGIIAMRDGKT